MYLDLRGGSWGIEVVRERGHTAQKSENGDSKSKQSIGSVTERIHFWGCKRWNRAHKERIWGRRVIELNGGPCRLFLLTTH